VTEPLRPMTPKLRLLKTHPPPDAQAWEDRVLAALRRGDSTAAADLYDKLVPVVDRTFYRLLGGRDAEHDDLVQSTFEQLVLSLMRGRFAGGCSLETWVARIATHLGLNALRARTQERRHVERDASEESISAIPARDGRRDADAWVELEEVRRQLLEIDPVKAETLFLHDVLGHSLSEIAVMMKASVAATQSRLVRGRRELEERVEALRKAEVP
jgi:RNA polymerase sigma-70 factor (ECF subfamily)